MLDPLRNELARDLAESEDYNFLNSNDADNRAHYILDGDCVAGRESFTSFNKSGFEAQLNSRTMLT